MEDTFPTISPGWMEALGAMRTGTKVKFLCRSWLVSLCLLQMNYVNSKFNFINGYYLLSDCLVLGEPDKVFSKECVFLGVNLNDPGKWWDGVCNNLQYPSYADCLCKQ